MLKDALVLACDTWWKPFEEVVLGPDKDKIKTLRKSRKPARSNWTPILHHPGQRFGS